MYVVIMQFSKEKIKQEIFLFYFAYRLEMKLAISARISSCLHIYVYKSVFYLIYNHIIVDINH